MGILKIVGLSLGSIIVLFILTKIVGQREMSGLSIFDFMISITIGSIATEMAISLEDNLKELKLDKLWLSETLQKQGIAKIENIFLATYTADGNLSVYLTNNVKNN